MARAYYPNPTNLQKFCPCFSDLITIVIKLWSKQAYSNYFNLYTKNCSGLRVSRGFFMLFIWSASFVFPNQNRNRSWSHKFYRHGFWSFVVAYLVWNSDEFHFVEELINLKFTLGRIELDDKIKGIVNRKFWIYNLSLAPKKWKK